ncbi:MAG: hypothetical protein Q8O67_05615 [Deltaproteobacteria bacterium]|nr:hypothetical protein [Deltaproteobacteria bacterium]
MANPIYTQASVREMADFVHQHTRVEGWANVEKLSFETTIRAGAGLYIASTFAVLEDGSIFHDLAIGRLPPGVDGDVFVKERLLGPANGPPLPVPDDEEERLIVALVRCIGVNPTDVRTGEPSVGVAMTFKHAREEERAFQSAARANDAAVEAALASLTAPRKPWWRFW